MMYFGAILKAVLLVVIPITVSVYAALMVSSLTEHRWQRRALHHRATLQPEAECTDGLDEASSADKKDSACASFFGSEPEAKP